MGGGSARCVIDRRTILRQYTDVGDVESMLLSIDTLSDTPAVCVRVCVCVSASTVVSQRVCPMCVCGPRSESVESCERWANSTTQQVDLAFNVFFMIYFFIRVGYSLTHSFTHSLSND